MRKFIIPAAACALLFFSCSTQSKYEQLISDYVQTDSHGIKTDIQLQILEIKELTPITVKDSVEILKTDFETDKQQKIETANNLIRLSQDALNAEQKSRFKIQSMIDRHQKNIDRAQLIIDSLKTIQYSDKYESEYRDKVLIQPVQCRYSFVFPKGRPRQEIEEILYVKSDLSKITGRKRVKK